MDTLLVVGKTEDENGYRIIMPFSTVNFAYDDDEDKYIYSFITVSGEECTSLEAVDGSYVKIIDLKCKSYEELLVQMDLHNLWHIASTKEVYQDDNSLGKTTSISLKQKIKQLSIENRQFSIENRQLKLKLKQLKILLNNE